MAENPPSLIKRRKTKVSVSRDKLAADKLVRLPMGGLELAADVTRRRLLARHKQWEALSVEQLLTVLQPAITQHIHRRL